MNKLIAKLFVALLKYLPVIRTLMLMIHLMITICGGSEFLIKSIVRISPSTALFMVVASYALEFCRLHRHFTYYNLIVSCLMMYNEEIGFRPDVLLTLRVIFIFAGIALLVTLYIHRKGFDCDNTVIIRKHNGINRRCDK